VQKSGNLRDGVWAMPARASPGKTPTTKAEIQRAAKIAHPRFGGYLANR